MTLLDGHEFGNASAIVKNDLSGTAMVSDGEAAIVKSALARDYAQAFKAFDAEMPNNQGALGDDELQTFRDTLRTAAAGKYAAANDALKDQDLQTQFVQYAYGLSFLAMGHPCSAYRNLHALLTIEPSASDPWAGISWSSISAARIIDGVYLANVSDPKIKTVLRNC